MMYRFPLKECFIAMVTLGILAVARNPSHFTNRGNRSIISPQPGQHENAKNKGDATHPSVAEAGSDGSRLVFYFPDHRFPGPKAKGAYKIWSTGGKGLKSHRN